MKNKHTFFISIFALMLLVFTATTVNAKNQAAFQLNIDRQSIIEGEQVNITVSGSDVNDIYAFEAVVEFDDAILEFVSAKSAIMGFQVPARVDGNKIVFAMSKTGNVGGENGNINICTFTFRGKAAKATKVKLEVIKVLDSTLQSTNYQVAKEVALSIVEASSSVQDNEQIEQKERIMVDGKKVKIVVKTDVNINNGTITAAVNEKTIEDAFKLAVADGKGIKEVVFEYNQNKVISEYILELPKKVLTAKSLEKRLEIQTPIATMIVSENMLIKEDLGEEDIIRIRIRKADLTKIDEKIRKAIGVSPVIELNVMVGEKIINWNNYMSPVTVAVEYTPSDKEIADPEHIVVWYLDEDGKAVSIPNGRYNSVTGKVVFTTTHFSKYAIAYVNKSFADISNSYAKKAIEVLASKGIISGTSESTFDPKRNITRADYIQLVVNTLGLEAEIDSNFIDVKPDDYYYNSVGIAKKLGLVAGVGANKFDPKAYITRQDMLTLTAKAMNIANKLTIKEDNRQLQKFSDAEDIAAYAKDGIASLININAIRVTGRAFMPKEQVKREEVAELLYNIYMIN